MDPISIRCAVAVLNANGEPDLFFCWVNCTQDQYDNGHHYRAAKRAAEERKYETCCWACDEHDPAWQYVRYEPDVWAPDMVTTTIQESDCE